MPLLVMPGKLDPSNHSLPQQPFHPCILQEATRFSSTKLASNPYLCKLGGRQILGHAGQPVHNLMMVTDEMDPLQLLKSTLDWGHIVPTAPDTLGKAYRLLT